MKMNNEHLQHWFFIDSSLENETKRVDAENTKMENLVTNFVLTFFFLENLACINAVQEVTLQKIFIIPHNRLEVTNEIFRLMLK